jgi:hypothetical protein
VATVLGVLVLAVSLGGGNVISLGTLVGVLFLAVAAVRYRLAQGG